MEGTTKTLLVSGDIAFLAFVLSTYLYNKQLNNNSLKKPFKLVLLSLIIYAFSSLLADKQLSEAITKHMRLSIPLLVFFSLNQNLINNMKFKYCFFKYIKFYIILISVLFMYGVKNISPIFRHGAWTLPPYFQNTHTTAYVLLSSYFIAIVIIRNLTIMDYWKKILYCAITFTIFYLIFFGLGVKAATLGFLTFIFLSITDKIHASKVLKFYYFIMIVLLFLIFLSFNFAYEDLFLFSSGRIGMYNEKIDQLTNNNLITWLLGNGVDSDFIVSSTWSWAKENMGAHNDFISILVEYGLIGIYIFFLIFSDIIKTIKAQKLSIFLLSSFFMTSVVSNGIISRPIASYIFFTALSISFIFISSKDINKNTLGLNKL